MTSDAHESPRAVIAALAANVGIAIAKLAGFLVTGSGSMLAESAHSVADSGNQGLLLFGHRRAKRGADREHPFGYTRERYWAAFTVAVVLFTAGAGFALQEGIEKLRRPEELTSPLVAIVILGVAIVLEALSFRTAYRLASELRSEESWWTFIRRTKAADLAVVLLEDTAALIGLALALLGVGLAAATHDPVWDALGTLAIAALLAVIAFVLAIETKSLLIGESAGPEEEAAIRRALASTEGVEGVIHLRTEQRGPSEILVAAKVAVRPDAPATEVAAAIDRAERAIREAAPAARYVFIEPDIAKEGATGDGGAG